MPHGDQLAQVAHAAAEAGGGHTDSTHVVVLAASRDEIDGLYDALVDENVPCSGIFEPDPPYCGGLTAIGFPVQPRERLRPWLRHLKLAGGRS